MHDHPEAHSGVCNDWPRAYQPTGRVRVWSGSGSPNLRDYGEPEAMLQGSIKSVFHLEDVLNHSRFTAVVSCQLQTVSAQNGLEPFEGVQSHVLYAAHPGAYEVFLPWQLATSAVFCVWMATHRKTSHHVLWRWCCRWLCHCVALTVLGLGLSKSCASQGSEVVHSACFPWWAHTPSFSPPFAPLSPPSSRSLSLSLSL